MKPILMLLLFGLVTAACTSKTTVVPGPDAGTIVAGAYPMIFIEADSAGSILYQYKLPYTVNTNTLSGVVTARRDSANAVFLTQTIRVTGQTDQTSVIGQISLRANGVMYDMYLSNRKIGTADGRTISIDDQQTDAQTGTKYRTILTAGK